MNPRFWSFQSDLANFEEWFLLIHTRYYAEVFRIIISYILYIVTTWQICITFWEESCPNLKNFTPFSEEWPSYFISRAPKSKCGELTKYSEIAIFWPFSNAGLHSLSNLQTQFQIICLYYKKTTCAQTIAWFEAKSHILAWLSDPAVKTFVPSYKTKDSFIKYVSQFHAILA